MPSRRDSLPPLFTPAFILAALANALLNFAAFLFVHLPGFLSSLARERRTSAASWRRKRWARSQSLHLRDAPWIRVDGEW